MFDSKIYELWDNLVELGIATDEEIGLATALCGTSIETLEKVLDIRTGFKNLEQIFEEEEEEE